MSYTDRALLMLRRQYSKDETVAALSKKLSEVEVDNGQLRAEVAHLEHLLEEAKNYNELDEKARVEARKENLYKEMRDKIKFGGLKLNKIRKTRDSLIRKNYLLEQEIKRIND